MGLTEGKRYTRRALHHKAREGRVHRSQKKTTHPFCYIPIPAPVSNYSSSKGISPGDDFYNFINHEWISKIHVPAFENDFGVSEEVERCVFNKSVQILETTKEESLIDLKDSFFKDRHTSIEYIHSIVKSIIVIIITI